MNVSFYSHRHESSCQTRAYRCTSDTLSSISGRTTDTALADIAARSMGSPCAARYSCSRAALTLPQIGNVILIDSKSKHTASSNLPAATAVVVRRAFVVTPIAFNYGRIITPPRFHAAHSCSSGGSHSSVSSRIRAVSKSLVSEHSGQTTHAA